MNFNPQASKGGFFGYALTNSEKSDTKVCTTTAMKSNYTIYHFCLGFICFDFFSSFGYAPWNSVITTANDIYS